MKFDKIKKIQWVGMAWLLSLPTQNLWAQVAPPVTSAPCATPWDCGFFNANSAGLPRGRIIDIIDATLSWLLGVLGFIAIIAFVISGLLYLTSAGNENQAEQAKNAMKYAIIGVIVALVGFVAIQAIDLLLGADPSF